MQNVSPVKGFREGFLGDWLSKDKGEGGDQSKIQTPPLNKTPMPKLAANTQQKDPITNLTRTEQALLSPSEKIIAGRT